MLLSQAIFFVCFVMMTKSMYLQMDQRLTTFLRLNLLEELTELSQGRAKNLHGALPSQTFGGSLPNSEPSPAETYAQGPRPTQSTYHPPLNHSLSKAPEEAPINQMPETVPSISGYQVNYCQVPPVIVPLSRMGSSSADQSQSLPRLARTTTASD